MNDNSEEVTEVHWSHLREDIAVVIWISFLVASVATMFFFGFVDPEKFAEILKHPWWLSHTMATYALTFFGFWFIAASAASLTAYMLDTSHEHFAHEKTAGQPSRRQS
ncbi:MAG: hypothetical protein AB7F79_05000 [Steroidobacteraceae bacterium]